MIHIDGFLNHLHKIIAELYVVFLVKMTPLNQSA